MEFWYLCSFARTRMSANTSKAMTPPRMAGLPMYWNARCKAAVRHGVGGVSQPGTPKYKAT